MITDKTRIAIIARRYLRQGLVRL